MCYFFLLNAVFSHIIYYTISIPTARENTRLPMNYLNITTTVAQSTVQEPSSPMSVDSPRLMCCKTNMNLSTLMPRTSMEIPILWITLLVGHLRRPMMMDLSHMSSWGALMLGGLSFTPILIAVVHRKLPIPLEFTMMSRYVSLFCSIDIMLLSLIFSQICVIFYLLSKFYR